MQCDLASATNAESVPVRARRAAVFRFFSPALPTADAGWVVGSCTVREPGLEPHLTRIWPPFVENKEGTSVRNLDSTKTK